MCSVLYPSLSAMSIYLVNNNQVSQLNIKVHWIYLLYPTVKQTYILCIFLSHSLIMCISSIKKNPTYYDNKLIVNTQLYQYWVTKISFSDRVCTFTFQIRDRHHMLCNENIYIIISRNGRLQLNVSGIIMSKIFTIFLLCIQICQLYQRKF